LPGKRSKKKRRPRHASDTKAQRQHAESRGGEALTVFWMITAMATLVGVAASALAALLRRFWINGEEERFSLTMLPGVLLFTALVTGTLCLILIPIVFRVRREPPPRTVLWTAVLLGFTPWAALFFIMLRS
jgi:hypothetical protein